MKKVLIIISLICISMLFINCPGFFDRSSDVDESEQCYVLDYTIGSSGSGEGEFNVPLGMDVDSSNNIYIADSGNNRIVVYDSDGNYLTSFGESDLSYPSAVAIYGTDLYVADKGNHRIVQYDTSGNFIGEISLFGNSSSSSDGGFNSPEGIAIDDTGAYIVVADRGNDRIQIYDFTDWEEVTVTGDITSFSEVSDVFIEIDSGTTYLYFSEKDNHRIGKIINDNISIDKTAFSIIEDDDEGYLLGRENGIGVAGSGEGSFNYPRGLDVFGTYLYVADTLNGRIQQFNVDGTFTEAWSRDGNVNTDGDSDTINFPVGIVVDEISSTKYIYVTESSEDRFKRFKFRCN